MTGSRTGKMIELLLYQVQKDDKHHFENIIWRFQEYKKDPDPESVHGEFRFTGSQFGPRSGQMFSSSGRGGFLGKGTRFVSGKIDEEKWKIYPLILTTEEEIRVFKECIKLKGKFYDWPGIVGMVIPKWLRKYIPKFIRFFMFWCSEVVNYALFRAGVADDNPEIRPSQMVESYRDQGLIKT